MAVEANVTPRLDASPARRPRRESGSEDVDWFGLLRTLWRRKLFIALVALLGTLLTLAYVMTLPPRYESQATVILNNREQIVTDIEDVVGEIPATERGLQGQLFLIKSRATAERLVDELNLHMLPEFNPSLDVDGGGWLETLRPSQLLPASWLERLPEWLTEFSFGTSSAQAVSDEERAARLRQSIVDNVLDAMQAEVSDRADVITLGFVSQDSALAALAANRIAEFYIDSQLETKQSASDRAGEFLQEEIDRLRASLSETEQRMQQYRRESGLLQGGGGAVGGGGTIDDQQITQLTVQLANARGERAAAEARLRQLERGGGGSQLLESSALTQLRAREIELNRLIFEASNEFGERHPRMVALRAELDGVRRQIASERGQILQGLRTEVRVAQSREDSLREQLDALQDSRAERNDSLISLEAMQREAEADRMLLETYLARSREIASQRDVQAPDARILTPAVEQINPNYPPKQQYVALAFAVSLLLGCVAVLTLEYMDDTFRSGDQVESHLGVTALGLIPAIRGLERGSNRPETYAIDRPNSAFAESLRNLRTGLLLSDAGGRPKTLLFTSSVPEEGKTSVTVSLARLHASSNKRTLLLDGDLRRPRLHQAMGVDNTVGLADVLLGDRELEDVLRTDQVTGLHYATAGSPVRDPAVVLASDAMRVLLKAVSAKYDLVIVDSAPVISVSDARVLSRMVDGTVFLVRWGHTKRREAMNGVRQLLDAGANLTGVVLSRVDVRRHARYGYSDSGYYYNYRYTKYYDA